MFLLDYETDALPTALSGNANVHIRLDCEQKTTLKTRVHEKCIHERTMNMISVSLDIK